MNQNQIDLINNWDPTKISKIPKDPLCNQNLSAKALNIYDSEIIFTSFRNSTNFSSLSNKSMKDSLKLTNE